ncbi:MAG: copper chaperone PCu(A)C [Gemmatimonadaceae bacterium]|nr:copper chaperone PCu(A)C [Gemmatimonadaceae bacterium]
MLRALLLTVAPVLAAACGKGGNAGTDPLGAPRMRPAEQGASSAVYFMLRNPGPDTLVLHAVEIDVAGSVMIHRSVESNGMSSMVHVDSVIVPPHDSVPFAERGLHIMASDLHSALLVGDTVVARLQFRPARVDTVRIAVRE